MAESTPSPDDRTARVGAVVVIGVATLVVAGLIFWFSISMLTGEANVQCGSAMRPGELCENLRTGHISTYSERQSGEQSARTAIGWVAFLAGLGALGLGVIMMRFAWTATPDPPSGGSTPPTIDRR